MDQLEIALKEINGEAVRLKSMSTEALDAFMSVVSSLKALAISVASKDDLHFIISDGSAQCTLEAPESQITEIYKELDTAIKGQGKYKEVTSNLRSIQDQIKRDKYEFRFLYRRKNKPDIDLKSRLITAPRIALKRQRTKYEYKLKVQSGFLNQIGGKIPNYHFDYGGGDKITISCTREEANFIKQYLYKDIQALILCKEWFDQEKKTEYFHKTIIEGDIVKNIRPYIKSYGEESELVQKLTLTHEFIDDMFCKDMGIEILYHLLLAFNDINFHLSEIKTLLVISKSFNDSEKIKEARVALYTTYQEKKSKSKI